MRASGPSPLSDGDPLKPPPSGEEPPPAPYSIATRALSVRLYLVGGVGIFLALSPSGLASFKRHPPEGLNAPVIAVGVAFALAALFYGLRLYGSAKADYLAARRAFPVGVSDHWTEDPCAVSEPAWRDLQRLERRLHRGALILVAAPLLGAVVAAALLLLTAFSP